MSEAKKIKCTLKKNMNYGTAFRKGLGTGNKYEFAIGKETLVDADDMKGFTDPKSEQFEQHIEVLK